MKKCPICQTNNNDKNINCVVCNSLLDVVEETSFPDEFLEENISTHSGADSPIITPKKIYKKKSEKIVIGILIALIILIIGIIIFFCNTVYVSDLKLTKFENSINDIYSNLNIKVKYYFNDSVPKGYITYQSISEGSFVPNGTELVLHISKGAGIVIPNLENMKYKKGNNILRKLGLNVSVVYKYNENIAKNRIIKIKPVTHLEKGDSVKLYVSKGPDIRVKVPKVSDLYTPRKNKLNKSIKKLKKAGFKVKIKYKYAACDSYAYTLSKTQKLAQVVDQSLTGKQEPGKTVTLTVVKPSVYFTLDEHYYDNQSGLKLKISLRNISGKNIKKVVLMTYYTTKKDKKLKCNVTNKKKKKLIFNTPIATNNSATMLFDSVFYNENIRRLHIKYMTVTFADGSTQKLWYSGYWYWNY